MASLFALRLAKLAFTVGRPSFWPALRLGVAPSVEHRGPLRSVNADAVIDVGANRGQFSLIARHLMPGVRIDAFEPLPAEAAMYRWVMGGKTGVTLHPHALGDAEGSARLHVSRRADSSSLLPIGRLQSELFPDTDEVGVIEVPVRTLDSMLPGLGGASRMLLKLDVQGFELAVLRGSGLVLERSAHVYAECSEVALYEGQALFPEVEAFLRERGFRLLSKSNPQTAGGRLIQSDCLFGRA